jgi:WD40 repeat-containing protein SMU1
MIFNRLCMHFHYRRAHGMKSGKLLKELRGHTSFVNCLSFSPCYTRLLSGSSDGTLRVRRFLAPSS